MNSKAVVKKVAKSDNMFEIKLTVTKGELLALKHGMQYCGQTMSAVGADVSQYIENALNTCPETRNIDD